MVNIEKQRIYYDFECVQILKYLPLQIILLILALPVIGQIRNKSTNLEIGIEYLVPTSADRQIHTISTDLFFGWMDSKRIPFTFNFGLTGTSAWGEITQLDEFFNAETFKNQALGIGPVYLIQYQFYITKNLSISPLHKGGIIFYNHHFPYGGDIYNFMWRFGAAAHYRINCDLQLNLSYIWMHVSNGQGISPKNPSYEAKGLNISFTKSF